MVTDEMKRKRKRRIRGNRDGKKTGGERKGNKGKR